jgi:hypothetical protein
MSAFSYTEAKLIGIIIALLLVPMYTTVGLMALIQAEGFKPFKNPDQRLGSQQASSFG